MSNFINLNDTLRSMETDPSTARDPIKRMFVCDGEFMTANLAIVQASEDALHSRPRGSAHGVNRSVGTSRSTHHPGPDRADFTETPALLCCLFTNARLLGLSYQALHRSSVEREARQEGLAILLSLGRGSSFGLA